MKRTPLQRGTTPLARTTRMAKVNRKRKGSRFPKTVNKPYRVWVAGLRCCVCRIPGPSHAHHVKTRGAGGTDAGNLVPLCAYDHDEIHRHGRHTFARAYRVDLSVIAADLWAMYQAARYPGEPKAGET